jgi:hypothetical protein
MKILTVVLTRLSSRLCQKQIVPGQKQLEFRSILLSRRAQITEVHWLFKSSQLFKNPKRIPKIGMQWWLENTDQCLQGLQASDQTVVHFSARWCGELFH